MLKCGHKNLSFFLGDTYLVFSLPDGSKTVVSRRWRYRSMPRFAAIYFNLPRAGDSRRARERKTALAIYPTAVITLGTSWVNPSENFIAHAHVTSSTPANANIIHFISIPPTKRIAASLSSKTLR